MRLVQLDDRFVIDADRVVALVAQHYTQPTPLEKVDVHVRGLSFPVSVVDSLSDVMAKLRMGPDLSK